MDVATLVGFLAPIPAVPLYAYYSYREKHRESKKKSVNFLPFAPEEERELDTAVEEIVEGMNKSVGKETEADISNRK